MMAAKVIVFAFLLAGCCYALPFRVATIYGSPLLVVPVLVEDLEEPQTRTDEEPMYALEGNSDTASSFNVVKRSVQEANYDDDDDLETAAGSNVLRPLFVYRQQIAYRQRAREAGRRGRRI